MLYLLDVVYFILSLISLVFTLCCINVSNSIYAINCGIFFIVVFTILMYHFLKKAIDYSVPFVKSFRKTDKLAVYLISFIVVSVVTLFFVDVNSDNGLNFVINDKEISQVKEVKTNEISPQKFNSLNEYISSLDSNNPVNLDTYPNWYNESKQYIFQTDSGRLISYVGKFNGYPDPVTDECYNSFCGWECVKYSNEQVIFKMKYTLR